MRRSSQWLVCAAVLFAATAGFLVFWLVTGFGPFGVILLPATGIGALVVSRRFRKLEAAPDLKRLNQQMDRFW